MRPRIPYAYAGLLIVALVAVVGFAAFSPSDDGGQPIAQAEAAETPVTASGTQFSARVASAILALRVTDTSPNTLATTPPTTQELETTTSEQPTTTDAIDETTSSSSSSSTTKATTTTTKPRDTNPPALTITSPSDGATVSDRIVTFKGTAEAGAKVYSGPYDAKVDDDGDWTIKLVVATSGDSTARITAEDAAGNTTVKSVTVSYSTPSTPPPSPTTTQGSTPTTTSAASKWSPLWPADPGGNQNVENWRPLVAKYFPDHLVNCALNIIYLESRGNPRAYNGNGAGFEGLFQHHSGYWKGRAAAAGFRDSNGLYATPYNAEANIAAAWYLASNSSTWNSHWSVDPTRGPLECTP